MKRWGDIDPNKLVLTFGGLHVCVQFGEFAHARTDAKRFYYLSHAICYSYGADNEEVNPQNCPSTCNFITLLEKDRATAIGNIVNITHVVLEI